MKRTYEEKSRQLITSVKPTALNLQPRGFAPPQSESDEDVSSLTNRASSENLLEKLISTSTPELSATSVQRKPQNRLKAIALQRMQIQAKQNDESSAESNLASTYGKPQNRLKAITSQGMAIQAKLNIGEPNDKYEKEADNTASKVVQQINSPTQDKSVQRQESMEEEDELQMKPVSSIQRDEAIEEEDELQMKPISKIQREESIEEEEDELQMKSLVQRRENIGGGEASTDLELSIQSARGSGQSLDAGLQAKMGQAMGADFSGVKVHTDSQSDQLNKSIQAKAFTSGQDVFFRQGEYTPSSKGGQELIAHELTHVVQQNGGVLHRQMNIPEESMSARKMISIKSDATIQRRFDDGTDFLDATDSSLVDLKTIADAMDEYNAYLDNDNKTPTDKGVAAGNLKLIERTIFAYINANNATYETLAAIPHYQELENLRIKAGEEHEEFVQEAVDDDSLPFDFIGIPREEHIPLIRLWNQIKGGLGKIQLVGDPANKKSMRSGLVKLLETPTGRQLLHYLNEGDPSDALTNIYIGQTKDQLPMGVESGAKAKGKQLEDTGVSEAQPLGSAGELLGPFDVFGDENPRDYLIATSVAEFRTALLKRKKGVILGNKKYEFNKKESVGAFVTAHEGASKNESAIHHQIMTPGWLTMGHELGHAAHMRGGGTHMMDTAQSPDNPGMMETLTGENPEKLNSKWQNAEEYQTINNWENSLRGDVGLTARDSHIPYTAGKKVERYYSIWPDIKSTFQDSIYLQTQTLNDFKKKLQKAFNSKNSIDNLENDLVYQQLQQEWLVIKTSDLDAEAIQKKKDIVKLKYDDMERKYQKKLPLFNAKWFPSKSKKKEWEHLCKERTAIINIYTNNLDANIDLNVAPDQSLFAALLNRIDTADEGFFKFTI